WLSSLFNDTPPPDICTLSLHDALPILLTRCRLQCPLWLSGGRPHYRGRSPRLRSIASLRPLIAAPRKASAITPWHSAWLIWDCVSEKWQGSNWKISIGTEARCD